MTTLTQSSCSEQGFKTIDDTQAWVKKFVQWYNHDHKYSKIRFVTPVRRHKGEDVEILEKRKRVYEQAKQKTPQPWSGETRNWDRIANVTLNPEKEPDQQKAE